MRYAKVLMVITSEISMATTSVRLDQDLVEKASIIGKALNRTTPKQIEHWAKISGAKSRMKREAKAIFLFILLVELISDILLPSLPRC